MPSYTKVKGLYPHQMGSPALHAACQYNFVEHIFQNPPLLSFSVGSKLHNCVCPGQDLDSMSTVMDLQLPASWADRIICTCAVYHELL